MTTKKIVWLLGAGFSKPLGGPLLEQLLSRRYVATAQGMLCKEQSLNVEEVAVAYELLRGDGLVDNAEDFLGVLDTAQDDAQPQCFQCRSILQRLDRREGGLFENGPTFTFDGAADAKDLAAYARLQIACSCESFVPVERRGNELPEQWEPYKRWADDLLAPEDTVITFNYDRAVEWIAGENQIYTLKPSADQLRMQDELGKNLPKLLKLHGSVDWFVTGANSVKRLLPQQLREWFGAPDADRLSRLAIGVPGPAKGSLSGSLFRPLWERAKAALESASAVVIVGYRMPDSDGKAMTLLREGLQTTRPRVHLVLGPRTDGEDMVRLRGYLENLVGKPNLDVQPAWAEGFFHTVPGRAALTG